MKVCLRILITILVSLLYGRSAFAQDIHFTTVEPPKNEVPSLIAGMSQDPQGNLWMTGNGLHRYNRFQYQFYRHDESNPNSIATDRTEAVFADKDGTVWVGSWAGLDHLDPATGIFKHYRHYRKDPSSIASDTILAIIRDHAGTYWIGTEWGVDKFDPATGKFVHHQHLTNDPGSLSNNQVRIIYEDRAGTIWVGCGSVFPGESPKGEGGLNRLDRKTEKFTRFLHDDKNPGSLINNRIRAIFEDSRGIFWIGIAGDGLYTMNRAKGTFQHYAYDPEHPDKLSRPPLSKVISYAEDHITAITEDIAGRVWIVTFESGINVYDPKTQKVTHYGTDIKTGLKTNELWYAYRTRDGLLWISTWGDDNIFDLYKINLLNKLPYHYIEKGIGSFAEDKDHNLWVSTRTGIALKRANDSLETFPLDKTLQNKNGLGELLVDDESHKLWVGTLIGLFSFEPTTKAYKRYHHLATDPGSLVCDTVFAMLKGKAGELWIATWRGLDLMNMDRGTFKHIQNIPKDTGRFGSLVLALSSGKDGQLWVGTYIGLNRYDERTKVVKKYLTKQLVYCIKKDNKDNLWVGTNKGLFKYDPKKDDFYSFTDNFGILKLDYLVYSITADKQNKLWLKTPGGIIRLDAATKEATLYSKNKGVDDQFSLFSVTLKNGEVLISDSTGCFEFMPEKLLHSTPAPLINIVSLSLANIPVLPGQGSVLAEPIAQAKEVNLDHDQNTFSLGFEAIDYLSAGTDNLLEYKLENYDGSWRIAGDDRKALYFNIAPGRYVFKVKAINDNGLWAYKDITVIISPPWWQTWWAYVLYACLFAATIWAFVYFRSLQLIKEKRILEHKVQVRTEEVLQQKEEIEAQRDSLEKSYKELKTTQTQLIQSEKMASLGELTAGIAHEIQNPLNFVNNFSEVNTELIDELKSEIINGNIVESLAIADTIQENQQKINLHGQRADAIVKAMLQHSRSASGQKEPTNINALADEYLRLAYHGLRAKDKSFNATTETHFDKSIGEINISPQYIGRVILNLLNNAFYAVNEKKKLQPEGYEPTVTVTTQKSPDQITISVRDNGNGIPQKILDKIYQPFFTTKPTGQGTGLGLSMSYDIIKAHGGELSVETVEGEFTEFIISLPIN